MSEEMVDIKEVDEEKSFEELSKEAELGFKDLTELVNQMKNDPGVPDSVKNEIESKLNLTELSKTIDDCKKLSSLIDK